MNEAVEFLNAAAKTLGFAFLGAIGIMLLAVLVSVVRPEKYEGHETNSSNVETEGTVADIVHEDLENPEQYTNLEYEPSAVCSFDWSMGWRLEDDELQDIKSVLDDAGWYVHPFPRSPDGFLDEEWHWGTGNMGVWREEPRFYVEAEDGREIDVTPDLSDWSADTEQPTWRDRKEYGYMDEWERENIHGMGRGSDV